MDRTVKAALAAGLVFTTLAWWGTAEASDLRVMDAPDMTSAEQVVRIVVGGRGQTLASWLQSKVAKGLVVLAGPKGVEEDALLYSVDKDRAKAAVATGFFTVVAGSVS